MFRFKSWRISSHNPVPLPRVALLTRGHSTRWSGALVWATLLCALLLLAPVVLADAPIQVLSAHVDYTFSQSLDFSLQAQADCPIVEAILFYGVADSGLVRRIYPVMQPGTEVSIEYSEQLEGGQYAPGVQMQMWWELVCQDGTSLRTEPQRFEYTDRNHEWQVLPGERVDLHWYGKTREANRADEVLQTAETAIARLEDEIGVAVDRQVQVYVYNSQSDMRLALSSRSQVYDDRVMTLGVTVSEDTLLLLGSSSDLDQVTAHELSHIVVGLATDNPYLGLPRWLDEGLAMYAEGDFPTDNKRALDSAVADDALLSIRSLSSYSGHAEQVDLYYGEVRSVVDYMLAEYGKDKLDALLNVFAQGARADDALQQIYGFGVDELDNRWRGSLGLEPRPESRTLPHGLFLRGLTSQPGFAG